MPTVGLLYPGHSAEDDFAALERRLAALSGLEVRLPVGRTSVGEDAHRVDALIDLGGHERLAAGARTLVEAHRPDALVWACTSGSFVFGWHGARDQVRRLADATGLPASSTSIGFVEACHALGLERVAVAASYPHDVAGHFAAFLRAGEVDVRGMGSHGILTAAEVGSLGREAVLAIAAGVERGDAQAVLVPDTAMHTLAWLDDLEREVGLPVLTANQVTVHAGLALLGPVPALPEMGTLFASREAAATR